MPSGEKLLSMNELEVLQTNKTECDTIFQKTSQLASLQVPNLRIEI